MIIDLNSLIWCNAFCFLHLYHSHYFLLLYHIHLTSLPIKCTNALHAELECDCFEIIENLRNKNVKKYHSFYFLANIQSLLLFVNNINCVFIYILTIFTTYKFKQMQCEIVDLAMSNILKVLNKMRKLLRIDYNLNMNLIINFFPLNNVRTMHTS